MPKYRDVVTEFGDIVNLWCNDNTTAEQHAGLSSDSTDDGLPVYNPDTYLMLCLVSWPEHVLSPLYNCDCAIEFINEHDAIELLSHGEADERESLPWKILKHAKRHRIAAELESQLQLAEEADDTVSGLIDAAEAVLKEFCGDYTTKKERA